MAIFCRHLCLLLLFVAFNALPASAQTKIRYLLTSPTPNVAEAAHSSVPEKLGYWKGAGLDVEVKPFAGSTGATTRMKPKHQFAGRYSCRVSLPSFHSARVASSSIGL